MTIADVKQKIADSSAVAQVEVAIAAAEKTTSHNVYLHITRERALARAKAVDAGEITGKLAGVPFALKDNFLHFDGPTTASSKFLDSFEAPLQAEAVERIEAEGAICIGTVNLDAFAHGGSTENSAFGVTKNAVDAERVAGGSSGGSAVAVALGTVPFALGTDTGGSIRQPASFNGVVGLKPTYGAVSRYGVVAMASGTDTIGVLSESVEDTELVMDIMAGQDKKDMTTLPDFFAPAAAAPNAKKLALIKEFMADGVDEGVKARILAAAEALKQQGYTIEEVSLPILKHALAVYYVVVLAEISSNLARYDGIRYGNRSSEANTLDEVYKNSRTAGFVAENKRRILIGSYVLSSGYFDAYYQKAQKVRTLIIQDCQKVLAEYDALIGPVAPSPAFKAGRNADPLTSYLEDVMTVPASLAGFPAVSVPVGEAHGLPVGLQIIGDRQKDADILAIAKEVEALGE